ncbi:MAG: hypothetical protein LBR11_05085 [Deltaproteobacteria bacterium]|jgi:UTP:GlnB (protein PII) uridylyltransferase|nr:hypothetical protein [Deltaproteobacteria bacterium]
MIKKPPKSGDFKIGDFNNGERRLGRQEAQQLYEATLRELERTIGELKAKFKNEEAYNQFLAMLRPGSKTLH